MTEILCISSSRGLQASPGKFFVMGKNLKLRGERKEFLATATAVEQAIRLARTERGKFTNVSF